MFDFLFINYYVSFVSVSFGQRYHCFLQSSFVVYIMCVIAISFFFLPMAM
jgi:glycopeptide antibiotics resistance protein